jgi:hypothetical protein
MPMVMLGSGDTVTVAEAAADGELTSNPFAPPVTEPLAEGPAVTLYVRCEVLL